MPCDTSSVSKRTGKSAKSSRCEGKYAIVRTGKSASSSRCEGKYAIVRTGKSASSSRCEGKYAIVRTGKSASSSRCEGNCTIVRTCASAKLKRCTKSSNRRGRNKRTSSTNSPTGSRIWCCAPTSLLPQAKSLSLYLPVKASKPSCSTQGHTSRLGRPQKLVSAWSLRKQNHHLPA